MRLSALLGVCAVALASCPPENVTYEIHNMVAPELTRHIANLHKHLAFKQNIQDLIDGLTVTAAERHALLLTGESSSQVTRTSTSVTNPNGINQAITYVDVTMRGYGFTCNRNQYRTDYGPNLICTLQGAVSPQELVILGAHLDNIPASGRAPGANDDGSGSAALLSIAQTISLRRASFAKTLVLEYYTGEEQGLVGSRAQAMERQRRGDRVLAQIQSDMTAVHLAQDPAGIAFVQDTRASNPTLTAYVESIARMYSRPPFTVYRQVLSGSSCCSDHQSYHEYGFPSVGLIEPRGYTGDPQYHRVGDLVRRPEYDVAQLAQAARIALAAAADIAELL